jgi:DNA-binding MarR family transcriptional regulator
MTTAGTVDTARLRLVLSRLSRRLRSEVGILPPLPMSALATLAQHGRMRLGELAAREGVSPPVMSRGLAVLDAHQAVVRDPDPTDARSQLVSLSAEGERLLAAAGAAHAEAFGRRMAKLDARQRKALADALPALEALLGDE